MAVVVGRKMEVSPQTKHVLFNVRVIVEKQGN